MQEGVGRMSDQSMSPELYWNLTACGRRGEFVWRGAGRSRRRLCRSSARRPRPKVSGTGAMMAVLKSKDEPYLPAWPGT